jgi:acetolactate synthase-1/2/3 large subunit
MRQILLERAAAMEYGCRLISRCAREWRTNLRVADILVERLRRSGVSTVFSIPGGACSGLDDALFRSGLRVVVCQHEGAAGYMAAGYHRATGLPGVLVVTSGPGALNTVTPLAAARLDGDGVVVLAGDVSRADRGRGALQDGGPAGLHMESVMRPLVGACFRAESANVAEPMLAEALAHAARPHAAPAFLQIPIDVQRAEAEPVRVFIDRPRAAEPSSETVRALLDLLLAGARPTILVGRGVARAGAGARVMELAERLGAAVLTDADGIGAIPRAHRLFVGTFGLGDTGAGSAWIRANPPSPLLLVGARLDDTTTNGFAPALLGGTVLQIDDTPGHLGRAVHDALALSADIPLTLAALTHRAPPVSAGRVDELAAAILAHRSARAVDQPPLAGPRFHPAAVVRALRHAFPADTTWAADIGNNLLATLGHLEPDAADRLECSIGLGGMGSGIGLALGLALGGRSPVVGICGDGALMMHGNEVLTAAKHGIPVTLAVFQDGQLGMARHGCENVYGASDTYAIPSLDIVSWARALGAEGCLIDGEAALDGAARRPLCGPRVLVFPIDSEARLSNPREVVFNFSGGAQ